MCFSRVPPDVGLAPSTAGGPSPSTPSRTPPPTPDWATPSRTPGALQKEPRGVGGRGRERVGREGLWLEGRVLQLQWGNGGGAVQTPVGARPTSWGSQFRAAATLLQLHFEMLQTRLFYLRLATPSRPPHEKLKALGQKSCRTKVPRTLLRIFVLNFGPKLPDFFLRIFCCASLRGKRRPEKNQRKSPPFSNAKFPGKFKKITNVFWRAGKVTKLQIVFAPDPTYLLILSPPCFQTVISSHFKAFGLIFIVFQSIFCSLGDFQQIPENVSRNSFPTKNY